MKMSARIHGLFDYGIFIFLLFSPSILHISKSDSLLVYALGIGYLAFTILTQYSAGLISLIHFRIHGWVEFMISIGLLMGSIYLEGIVSNITLKLFFSLGTSLMWLWVFSDYSNRHFLE